MKKSICAVTSIILLSAVYVFGQVQTAPSLNEILDQASQKSDHYRESFKNLLADEIKTFEEFDKRGVSEKKTTVKSSFLVYQSGKNVKSTAELRNVLEINGKPIPDSQKRGEEFLAELDKQTTLESELKKLQSESEKYDKSLKVFGMTLNQAVPLARNQRPFFDYKLLGTENYQGAEVYVVSYQQIKKSPYVAVNEKLVNLRPEDLSANFELSIPGNLKKSDIFLRGKFWIDAKTFQVWREERELTARVSDPVVLVTNTFEYQPSDFGILVPKTISLTIYNAKKETGDRYNSLKDTNIVFEYSKFRQTNVEVKILDEETEQK